MDIKNHKDVAFSVEHVDFQKESASELRVKALLMYEGDFVDASGQHVRVSSNLIRSIANNYRLHLQTPKPGHGLIKKLFKKSPRPHYNPISLNHEKNDVTKIVGHVIDLTVEDHEGKAFLLGTLEVKGEENIKSVEDGRWREVSISFDQDEQAQTGNLTEISYVFAGAVDGACTFSKLNDAIDARIETIDQRSINFAQKKIDLAKIRQEKKRIEFELRKLHNKKTAYTYIDQMVKDGLISRSDFKKLAIDVNQVNLTKFDPFLRALKTIALSKKNARGQVSNNFQMSAFDSFMDGFNEMISQGGDAMKKLDTNAVADSIIAKLKGTEPAASSDVAFSNHSNQKSDDSKEFVKISCEDVNRMFSLAKMGDMDNLTRFMEESSGMEFKKDDEDEIEDEDGDKYEDEEETEDKEMGMEDDADMSKKKDMKKKEKKMSAKKEHDYAKQIDDSIVRFSKDLKEHEDALNKLTDAIVNLSISKEAK